MPVSLRRLAVPALALTLLTGCGGGTSAERAAQSAPVGATASAGGTPAGSTAGPDPAGRTLTPAQARRVIPPAAVLPGGWRVDRDRGLPSPTDAAAKIDPPRCQALFDELHRARKGTAGAVAASAEGAFKMRDTGPFLSVTVDSYARPVAAGLFDTASTALADCPRFTGSVAGTTAEFRASPLGFARLGDETLALRFIGNTADRPFTVDFVAVRVGHNTIAAQQVSRGPVADAEALQRMVEAAVERLPAG